MIVNYIKFLALYTIAAIVVGIGALVAAYPYHPITTAGWVVCFLLALPIYVTLESVAGRIFSKRIGYKIDDSRENISVSRIIFGFAFAVTAMLVGMVIVLSAGVAGGSFWEVNYSSVW
jgi:F0F1-type ATP synthase membrane subunit c/vacuolar-type H+-ATPase subunit K